MSAPDSLLYEYAIIRYVPRVDREEFINIGLIMLNKRNKWMKSKINIDKKKINILHPTCNTEALLNQARLFEMKDVPEPNIPIEEKYRWLSAVKSASLQVSPSHPGIAFPFEEEPSIEKTMEKEFHRLFNQRVL